MTTSIALAVLLTLSPTEDTKTVTVEAPGITCMGRFTDSLQEHVVSKHDWIRSVKVSYLDERVSTTTKPPKLLTASQLLLATRKAAIKFQVDANADPLQLARILKSCGYYDTKGWVLVDRRPFNTIKTK